MAIKVQGTTVIDDSRNLQNLGNLNTTGNIYANTFVGDASQLTNLPASGGTFEATASGTLADGSMVIVNADGTVSVPSLPVKTGAATALGSIVGYMDAIFDPSSNKIVLVYNDGSNNGYGTGVVGTISGTSLSFGTPAVFNSGSSAFHNIAFDSSNNKVIVVFRDTGNSNYGTAVVGTVSGTSISFGSKHVYASYTANFSSICFDSNENRAVIAHYKNLSGSTADRGIVQTATVSGTSLSFGSELEFSDRSPAYTSLTFDSNSNKAVLFYRDSDTTDNNNGFGAARVLTVSGSSISMGSKVIFKNASISDSDLHSVFDSTNNKVVVVYRSDPAGLYAVVGTVSGTSISFGAEAIASSSNRYSPRMAYNPDKDKIYVTFTGGSDYIELSTGTISGTSISFTTEALNNERTNNDNAIAYDTNSDKLFVAFKLITGYDKAFVYDPDHYIPPALTSENFIGISDGAYANGATATVQIKGAVDDAQSGLTPGQQYFVQADGSINTTAADPSVFAGTAIASNKLIVKG